MAEAMSIEPTGYDAHGEAQYAPDLLDLRWTEVIDALRAAGRNGLEFEVGLYELLYAEDVDLIRKGVQVIAEIAEREVQRRGYPYLLDTESGIAWNRRMRVADLRANAERYAEVAARAGWPADPAELDEKQLDGAVLVVLMPYLLHGEPWEPLVEEWPDDA